MRRYDLPDKCYVTHRVSGETVLVKYGVVGYFRLEESLRNIPASELNKELGISRSVEEAMFTGSMFGWDVPGVDPKKYGVLD